VVVRGDDREFVAFWLRDGRLTAAMNVNVWTGVPEVAQRLIRSGARLDPAALADPAVPLEDMTA
jgi:3-phenylpropionate/trans-cinnamate dioxygenase ferredoxin reductase subunit